ncbi:hypothetical protein P3T76_012050 [Phytophthora citrophthora]|uniref:RxLR effector protein n=1 Tax=Phytophthora citrophthora TaxID=4793 RepID=A0AAD9LDJ5_9STRA|nr:hypothetical protein P3T76_012050 [Phytophthora citrophthora]
MRFISVVAFSSFTLVSAISATSQINAATPVPATKLRTETNVVPPPQQQETQDEERRLGFWDWLIESPTAGPATPAPATPSFGNNDNVDDGPFSGPFWDPNATF